MEATVVGPIRRRRATSIKVELMVINLVKGKYIQMLTSLNDAMACVLTPVGSNQILWTCYVLLLRYIHAVLRSKSAYWLAPNQDNVSECSEIATPMVGLVV